MSSTKIERATGLLSPLASPVYRSLWAASVVSNFGSMMQSAAVAWLMTSLTSSPLLISMVPFATLAPVMLFGLLGGAWADLCNRRNWLLGTQGAMLAVSLALAGLTHAGLASPALLLVLTFCLGAAAALNIPAWQAMVQDLVPVEHVASAVSLNSMSFNTARMLGPVAGGLVTGAIGAAAVFYLNALSYVAVMAALFRWKNSTGSKSTNGGMFRTLVDGVRLLVSDPALRGPFLRVSVLCFFASAGMALLPALAREFPETDATRFGMLLGAFGAGALLGGATVPRMRTLFSPKTIVTIGAFVTAGALIAVALSPTRLTAGISLVVFGNAWIASMVNLNVSVQTSVPAELRGRAMALYFSLFQGCLAVGSVAAGLLARQTGLRPALLLSGIALALCSPLLARYTGFPEARPPSSADWPPES